MSLSGTTIRKVDHLDAVIASSGDTSAAVDVNGTTVCGIYTPSALTGDTLSFEAAQASDGTFVPVKDDEGNEYTVTVATSEAGFYYIPPAILSGVQFLKVKSSGTEAAERTFKLAVREV